MFAFFSREIEGEKISLSSNHGQANSQHGAVQSRGSVVSSKITGHGSSGKGPFHKSKSKEAQPKKPCVSIPSQDLLGKLVDS